MITEIVNKNSLYANIYYESGFKYYIPVLIWGGSEGGIWFSDMIARRLAEDGFLCMSLAYFGYKRLPRTLNRIRIEYFLGAIDHLRNHKYVKSNKINIIGISRGSESALYISTITKYIDKIIAVMPSGTMNEALPIERNKIEPAWKFHNKDIPPYNYHYWDKFTKKETNIIKIENIIKYAESVIPIENSSSNILLISAGKDKLWNSGLMAKLILRRNNRINKNKKNIKLLNYKHAGHFGFGIPEYKLSINDIKLGGGTINATSKARSNSWKYMTKYLRNKV